MPEFFQAMILRYFKSLAAPPELPSCETTQIRTFRDPTDVPAWLALRTAAFAGLTAGGPPWLEDDFRREFVSKPWWSPERMWLASDPRGATVGTVTLGRSGRVPQDVPCVMWLMVDPTHRRVGIGRLLLATLERAVWDAGERWLTLETHSSWIDAVRLYERSGYRLRK